MRSLLQRLKPRLFWIVARFCFTTYRAFPIFGSLRASIGIIHRGHDFLVIRRNDGRGLSLPGGIAGWKEPLETTLRREIQEETGLQVTKMIFRTQFASKADVPCTISVFEVEATGNLTESWEGLPQWMSLQDLQSQLVESQRPTLELMKEISAEGPTPMR